MAGTQPETVLVNRMRAAIAKAHPGVRTVKLAGGPFQEAGLPDLLCLVPPHGRAVWLEVKCPKAGESHEAARRRVTPRQAAVHDQLRASGCTVAVPVTVDEALAVLAAET